MATAAQRLATGRYGERSAAQWLSRQGMVLRRGRVVLAGAGEELLRGQDGTTLAASYL